MFRLLLALLLPIMAFAADAAPLLSGLTADERPARLATIEAIATSRDPRAAIFFEEYRQGSAYRLADGMVVLVLEFKEGIGQPLDPLSRATLGVPLPEAQLTALEVSGPERKAATTAITRLRITDPDPVVRLAAVTKAGDAGGALNRLVLAELQPTETDPAIARSIAEGLGLIDLADGDASAKLAAADALGVLKSLRAREQLTTLAAGAGPLAERSQAALLRLDAHQSWVRGIQTIFSGISAGSILVLMALGLSITFGLMGVINMAHGEMLMLGAYATLLTQWGFQYFLPPVLLPYYFILAIGAGFLAAACAGWLLELLVIRHLYGRPLETLLATWGISFLLIQSIRVAFGDNQAVTAPPWLVGGWEPMHDLVLPWNRLFIIALTVVSVVGVVVLFRCTRLGLLLRATVQSRRTAASLGVNTRRIDGITFALGSGLAGAAGCGITLIGGLKPDMGQEFIIDSFLVVATGGVGNLAGVCCAGFGLGLLNKGIEPFSGAVFAKVLMLVGVILFLQWRSQGIFPPKGRLADA